ncbi:MAG: RtcB family protein [Deltaproteobacteria bacterium]|nr:RtcB family protein [Deltaproteobacteria bacterium]
MEEFKVQKVDDYTWRIPKEGNMRVDGIVFASEKMFASIRNDESLKQVANVAALPGIVKASFAMPDIHWGYGFCIGGVAAFDVDEGVVSPGGVGYDISCSVRLLRTELTLNEVKPHIHDLMSLLFREIPTGVGAHRRDFKLSQDEEKLVLKNGAQWAVERGFGTGADLDKIEDRGLLRGGNVSLVSAKALARGRDQLGTLGSGNHFLEVGYVADIYDAAEAGRLGLFKNQITVFQHCGSRGLGYQVCDDYLDLMIRASHKYAIELPDRQLCSAPIRSEEGEKYLGAMACAANYAFANHQMITHYVRENFEKYFKKSVDELGLQIVYHVSHNMAKFEEHIVGGVRKRLLVHRKGATRAFPGQPVLIPGDMGRYSFVLVGTEEAMKKTFGSTCHGAGRLMSRHQAKRIARGRNIGHEMKDKGITVLGATYATIVEEMPEAYKDAEEVVNVVDALGISKKVARLVPIGVIKG